MDPFARRSTCTRFVAGDVPPNVWDADHFCRAAYVAGGDARFTRSRLEASTQEADVRQAAAGSALRAPCGATATRFLFYVPASFKYAAEAMALMGIAYSLIKWVGRTLRSLISDGPHKASRFEGLSARTPVVGADALVRQGLVTAAALEQMTPREREFLTATAGPQLRAAHNRVATQRPTPSSSESVAAAPRGLAARNVPTPTRLHLITPSRPPLGMAVHCPGCGVPLDRDSLQRTGATSCPRCKRPVSAHIQRGRLTVIVEETTEEADYRRRLDGKP